MNARHLVIAGAVALSTVGCGAQHQEGNWLQPQHQLLEVSVFLRQERQFIRQSACDWTNV